MHAYVFYSYQNWKLCSELSQLYSFHLLAYVHSTNTAHPQLLTMEQRLRGRETRGTLSPLALWVIVLTVCGCLVHEEDWKGFVVATIS